MKKVGRVLIPGLALFICCAKIPPKPIPDDPILVEAVRLEGFDVLPPDARDDLQDELPLRAGVTLTDEIEKSAGERAVEVLQNNGHPYAQVGIAREAINSERANVVMRAEPGTVGFFGQIDIAGNQKVDDSVIRRRLA